MCNWNTVPQGKFKEAIQGVIDMFWEEEAIGFCEDYLEDDERPTDNALEELALAHGNNSLADLVILKRWLESQPTLHRCCG